MNFLVQIVSAGEESNEGRMQELLMRQFYDAGGNAGSLLINVISNNSPASPVCGSDSGRATARWTGVTCRSGAVTRLDYADLQHPFFRIEFSPSTVSYMNLTENKIKCEVDTRKLPRSLKSLILIENLLYGTFCLSTLPPLLELLDIRKNRIENIHHLAALPPNIRTIDLMYNQLRTKQIYYGNLPESLQEFKLSRCGVRRLVAMPGFSHDSERFVVLDHEIYEKNFYLSMMSLI